MEYGYDIAVIGGGPAGYVAAIRGAQLGARVVLFEKDTVGGTCLNRGCIPTKTFLKTAEYLRHIRTAGERGIVSSAEASVDMPAVTAYKDKVVRTLTGGVASLLRANRVETVSGEAALSSEHGVVCGGKEYTARSVLLCGGSLPGTLPIPGLEGEGVLTSTEILSLQACPKTLCIIGGGVIGCEMATSFQAFGAQVTLVEMAPGLAPMFEPDVAKEVADSLRRQGVKLLLAARTERVERSGGGLIVHTDKGSAECEKLLVSVGRRPDLSCLGALAGRIACSGPAVRTDDYLRTNVENIYACGDVNGKLMLTHAAYHMGEIAAENCMGGRRRCDLRYVPNCMYTEPEVACVGLTEAEARKQYGDAVAVGSFRVGANGRAIASGERAGFVKVIIDRTCGAFLGVHMVGGMATEMIGEAAALMEAEVTVQEAVENLVHPHPSYMECFAEACQDALGRSLHQMPKK